MESNIHWMELPRHVVIGKGTLVQVGDVCLKLGFSKKVFVVTGTRTMRLAGQKVIGILEDEGIEVNHYIVSANPPTLLDVRLVEEKIGETKPQAVLGIGGGAKIDVAKLSAANLGIPFISIPTTASHDGMASPFASVKGLDRPYSMTARSPIAVIVDTDVIISVPYRLIASGCGDVLAKFTSTRDWKLAHERKGEYYAEYAASLALLSAQHVVRHAGSIKPGSESGLRVLLEALVSCGVAMCIGGTSKPCSGSEHLFSHALDLITPKPALHGEQCGLGAILMARLHGLDWESIRDTLREVGAPINAREIGIDPSYIVEALVLARNIRPERYTILNEKPLTRETAYNLARETGVID
ncbi:MAG: NAD(P)-dependent glycerol-1-phosphate dehydrogenase [Nitrososphaerota archaeon]|nr:NAD(P)-dependent glycerol-1-phosphate dehydrogenase [Candidatus Bathyarchaeota archaeon]MDW8048673.1 NAD(P)-dependent glycerol-1-phosphate dehydrogenase [Nitrososphaerota archaeon]